MEMREGAPEGLAGKAASSVALRLGTCWESEELREDLGGSQGLQPS